ncbi:unnamed protein product [Acanthoscelides obtectus]|uniref:chitin synthase n=2 Tax=Acanthoscelides obtectus TaxID=200917 RepID=A0A9P0M692_ACAOB|nr:unnamed protein product [Acanthoscelides obtectus]CAK1676919.1 Chitin synthase chs-2 [Acanthoscelides obtectus]
MRYRADAGGGADHEQSTRTVQETKGWDVFRDPPIKEVSGSMANQRCLEITVKILKVVAYLVTFVIVLGSGVISKGTLLFMTSQLRPDRVVAYCNRELGRDKQFIVKLPTPERVAWMWCIFFAFSIPWLGALFRSTRMCYFKSSKRPPFSHFLTIFLAETGHTIGLAIFVFHILPDMDVVKGAMLTNCLCFVPAVLGLLSRNNKESQRFIKVIIDLIAVSAQATGFVVWPIVEGRADLWIIPVSIFLISLGWWENYISKYSPIPLIKRLGKIKDHFDQTRYFTYMFISTWKIICFFVTILFIILAREGEVGFFFTEFSVGFNTHPITILEIKPFLGGTTLPDVAEIIPTGDDTVINSSDNSPIFVLTINVLASYFAYIFGKFACKIMIQGFSYAFPVNLTIPVTISLLITACGLRNGDPCFFHETVPDYLFFESPPTSFLNDFISHQHAWIWLLWLLSQTWITIHIWTPKCERLARTEKLQVTPMYEGLLIDQSLGLNRKRDDEADVKPEDLDEIQKEKADEYYETISNHTDGSSPKTVKNSDHITRIYACATMWHENREEMIEFLKSILRLDEDQSARRVAQKYLRVVDPDYYEFETHIFFDDAFEISDHNDDDTQVNRFVKLLIATIDEAASDVHQTHIRIKPPKKIPTPYGGRLIWTLPGKTKMIAHLKDKMKIRHRKRWSQVMYMYYLLGHRLMELPISVDRKATIAENTYLLTLDGDIDFQPSAVLLLIDLMKKNRNLGAACGRIHPVGSGPMVWYQLFEYAIGHWLQKATEHVIGCVLCSPGCFSLFRGKSLMDDNVMKKYTTCSSEARHYVQYDQGEDRWLCTLLLQRGYRVEYSAASDAYTHAPEGFNEFFNQRRRWVPSTIANIMDLLMDSKRTIEVNDNISMPYIGYQILLMGGTILGPGTIFLMLVGAFVAAFQIDNWTSFYYNIYPILFFMLVCFTCKSNIQLLAAQILSTGYALVMMAVIVGTALQLREDGVGSPSAIFLIAMTGSFFIAACLHPQEFWCIVPGIIYLLSIPAMYLLLILYSIINLNNVSWGTREVATKKTKKELEEERKAAEQAKKTVKQKSLLGFLQSGGTNEDDEGSIEVSLAGLFRCMFCTHQKSGDEKAQLMHIADSLDSLSKRLDHIERVIDPSGHHSRRRSMSASSRHGGGHPDLKPLTEEHENDASVSESDDDTTASLAGPPRPKRDELVNPYWIEDPDVGKGEVEYLNSNELSFWKDLLEKYLYPLDENKEEKARIASDLKELRDQSVFAFFMMNALFVLIVFLLTLKKDYLHVKWPFGVKTNITYDESTQEVHITKEYLQLEPIGLVFVFFFALILVIQFVAMLFHRFGTLAHILASTELNWSCTKKKEEMSPNALLDKQAVEIVKQLQKLQGIDGDYDNDSGSGPDRIGRRKTIHNLEKAAQKKRQIGTLDVAFKKRFAKLNANPDGGTPVLSRRMTMRPETMKALEVRVNSVMAERRKSHMQTLGAKNEFQNNNVTRNHRSSVASSIPAKVKISGPRLLALFLMTEMTVVCHKGHFTWSGLQKKRF